MMRLLWKIIVLFLVTDHQDKTLLLAIIYLKQAKNSKLYFNKILATQKSLYMLQVSNANKFVLWLSEIKAFAKCKHFVPN